MYRALYQINRTYTRLASSHKTFIKIDSIRHKGCFQPTGNNLCHSLMTTKSQRKRKKKKQKQPIATPIYLQMKKKKSKTSKTNTYLFLELSQQLTP